MAAFGESQASISPQECDTRRNASQTPFRATSMLSAPSQALATRCSHVPFPTSAHRVSKGRYITSKDPRGYMCVRDTLLMLRERG